MIWMFFKSGPVYFANLLMVSEEFSHQLSVGAMALHAQVQRLDAAQHKESILRSRHRPATVLNKGQIPVQLFVISYQRSHDDVRMSAKIFCHRMHNDVGAEGERILEVR